MESGFLGFLCFANTSGTQGGVGDGHPYSPKWVAIRLMAYKCWPICHEIHQKIDF